MTYALNQLRWFAHEHDDIPAFHAAYLVLTFLAAAMFNVGAFGLLIIFHMCLDIVKYREIHNLSWRGTLKGVAHESLVDVTLFMLALLISVYFHHSVGLVSVSGLLHAELSIFRALGTMIPKAIILEHFLKVVSHIHHYMEQVHPGMRLNRWKPIDKVYIVFTTLSLALLVGAPYIMNVDGEVIRLIVFSELVPWNF